MISASVPIMEAVPQNATVLDGKDATLTCRAVAAPSPNVTWIYNGQFDNHYVSKNSKIKAKSFTNS